MDPTIMVPFGKGLAIGALATLGFLALFCRWKNNLMPWWSFFLGLSAALVCYGFIYAPIFLAYASGAVVGAVMCAVVVWSRGKLC